MEELRIAICEDIKKDCSRLLSCIRESGFAAKCDTYLSGEAFLSAIKPGMYHLIYLDIYMDKITGMETAAAIRERDESVMLAFTTTSRDHAFEANKYRSVLYIEKPVTQDMVEYTLNMAFALRESQKGKVLNIPAEKKRLDIRHDDIIYVEVANQRCTLHLRGGKMLDVSSNIGIDDLDSMLPKPRFCRTHRSYIVNMDKVDHTNGTDFVMQGGGVAYITQKEYKRVMNAYDDWLFKQVTEEGL